MAYKFTTAFPDLNLVVVFMLSGVVAARGRPRVRHSEPSHQGVLPRGSDPSRPQFFLNWTFNKVPWFYNYNPSGTITVPPREMLGVMVGGPEATAETRYFIALVVVIVLTVIAKNLVRGPDRALLDGDPRYGRRGGDHRLPALPDEAPRVLDLLVLLRGGGGDVPLPLSRQRGERSLFDRSLVRGAVHGDHRRPRKPARLVPGRRIHRAAPDLPHERARSSSASPCPSTCKSTSS